MSEASHHVADAGADNWVERILPQGALPYAQLMRLDRPIGWWLLLLPCWWGLLLAHVSEGTFPNLWFAFLFFAGAVVMRGAGCTLNDIIDRKIDALVARTKSRPIPSGRISVKQAIVFLAVQGLLGLAILLQFDGFTIALGASSLLIVAPCFQLGRLGWLERCSWRAVMAANRTLYGRHFLDIGLRYDLCPSGQGG